MRPLCEICGTRHEAYQAHVFATNVERLTDATNGEMVGSVGRGDEVAKGVASNQGLLEKAPTGGRTANRRTREAYNAYQREYMRKRRGV